MGLFDGSGGADDPSFASTAHVAGLLDAPVVLVVDAASMSTSVAALVSGFRDYDPSLPLRGVVLNRVGSDGHEALLRDALEPLGIPVVGALRRGDAFRWRDRHLGLVPVIEHAADVASSVETLAAAVEEQLDLDALLRIAAGAAPMAVADPPRPERLGAVRIAVASGPAFSFCYPDNLEVLADAGAELLPFDPHVDEALPPSIDGLLAGGGFPEVYAAELAANERLVADVRRRVSAGLPTWAECGGLLWLSRALDGTSLVGALPAEARMTDRLTLGYRTAEVRADSPVGPAGSRLRGHEFHYSTIDPPGDALELVGRTGTTRGGFASPTLLASYLHVHLGGDPTPAEHFVATCADSSMRALDTK
jgi:cobyrinic acid a,c-diamide synthase